MCGRFTLRTPTKAVADFFGVPDASPLLPHFNIAVRNEEGSRKLVLLRWGFIPSWSDDPKIGYGMINARAETAAAKPAFRSAFRKRRCLILADGFYEWQAAGSKNKQPFYISMRDGKPFAFAGLWERWDKGKPPLETCTILTTEPNETLKPVHDRMPVILSPKDYATWLDPQSQEVLPLLKPYPDEEMQAYAVSTLVNKPSNDSPECIEPLAS